MAKAMGLDSECGKDITLNLDRTLFRTRNKTLFRTTLAAYHNAATFAVVLMRGSRETDTREIVVMKYLIATRKTKPPEARFYVHCLLAATRQAVTVMKIS